MFKLIVPKQGDEPMGELTTPSGQPLGEQPQRPPMPGEIVIPKQTIGKNDALIIMIGLGKESFMFYPDDNEINVFPGATWWKRIYWEVLDQAAIVKQMKDEVEREQWQNKDPNDGTVRATIFTARDYRAIGVPIQMMVGRKPAWWKKRGEIAILR